ncbi:uncharacterized protein TRIADDRAFT_59090 [Trichoplax adhaerens]|uniref:Uncharacterized protein n=1 Tax=Trichoplax adhaerens TaxID=10228 RepID=B3S4H8_TRIAD|nr:predicted protein [Trichoplax adhaerens]EDV22468.1 predicted protein [Trichoplax adhaerens]|eukprot:XP_002115012.1 predicted protein [Trichoplax adhaerens]
MDYCGTQDLDDANRSMKITSRVLIKDPLGNFEDDSFSDEEIDRNRNSEIVVNREVLERFPTSGDLLKDFLPQILIEKYNKPCLELIPYTPQSQFIHNVLKQTQASTSTAQKMSLEDCNEFYTPTIDDKEPNSERDVLVGGDEELDDYDDLIDADYMDFT